MIKIIQIRKQESGTCPFRFLGGLAGEGIWRVGGGILKDQGKDAVQEGAQSHWG
jgi:hypothetical protein